jgi:hypothetical protein
VQSVFPNLVSQDLNTRYYKLDYQGLIAPIIKAIQEIAQITGSFKTNLIAWLGDAGNGIGDFFANRVRTKEICLSDAGGETCVTRGQLDAMLAGAAASLPAQAGGGGNPPPGHLPQGDGTTSTPPVIQINGNNPATMNVGDVYSDLGAIITGPTAEDMNLGIHTFVNGVAMDVPLIDTSAAGTHTIEYVATNAAGTATSTRMVIVEAPAPAPAVATSATPTEPTATSTVETP